MFCLSHYFTLALCKIIYLKPFKLFIMTTGAQIKNLLILSIGNNDPKLAEALSFFSEAKEDTTAINDDKRNIYFAVDIITHNIEFEKLFDSMIEDTFGNYEFQFNYTKQGNLAIITCSIFFVA